MTETPANKRDSFSAADELHTTVRSLYPMGPSLFSCCSASEIGRISHSGEDIMPGMFVIDRGLTPCNSSQTLLGDVTGAPVHHAVLQEDVETLDEMLMHVDYSVQHSSWAESGQRPR